MSEEQGADAQTNQWAMILHFSVFAGYVVPFAGLLAPIIIWQIKKDELPGVDAHGKVVINWIISAVIYGIVSGLLCFVLIGFVLLLGLGIMSIAYPIIGGIKANKGELWQYPLSLKFIK